MANCYRTPRGFAAGLAAVIALLLPSAGLAQALNACDLNADGRVDLFDVLAATNMALGLAPCTANIAGAGNCNIVVIQRVVNAALGGECVVGVLHSATLSWTASTSSNVVGYNLYRGIQANGPYTKMTPTPVAGTTYTDTTVQAGQIYYYVATAVDNSNGESVYSNSASAVVPSP